MSNYYELIKNRDGLPIKAFIQSADRVKMHWHRDIEIVLVLQGSVNVRLGRDICLLKEKDLVLINNNSIHNTIRTKEDNILLVLKIDPDYYSRYYNEFANIVFDCRSFDYGKEEQERFDVVRHHLAKIVWEFNKGKGDFKLMAGSQIHLLLAYLVNNFKVDFVEDDQIINKNRDMERIQRIISYIEKNMDRGVSLQEVADREGLNVYYTSHFIKRALGMSFQEYLNIIRLDESLRLLSTTNKTITEISYESGFPSTKSLNRIFKREINCSPSEYRKANREQSNNWDMNGVKNKQYLNIYIDRALTKLFSYLKDLDYSEGNISKAR